MLKKAGFFSIFVSPRRLLFSSFLQNRTQRVQNLRYTPLTFSNCNSKKSPLKIVGGKMAQILNTLQYIFLRIKESEIDRPSIYTFPKKNVLISSIYSRL